MYSFCRITWLVTQKVCNHTLVSQKIIDLFKAKFTLFRLTSDRKCTFFAQKIGRVTWLVTQKVRNHTLQSGSKVEQSFKAKFSQFTLTGDKKYTVFVHCKFFHGKFYRFWLCNKSHYSSIMILTDFDYKFDCFKIFQSY